MRFLLAAVVAIWLSAVTADAASLPAVQTRCTTKSAKIRPGRILIACGDGNFFVTRMHWSSWTSTAARGRGTAHQNDCTPNCAAGHFHAYSRISIRLSRPHLCKGALQFGRLSWRYGASHPSGIRRTGFTTFPCV
jgi:hypothetical protein